MRRSRPFSRPAAPLEDRLATPELRVARLENGPGGLVLDVEVRETPALAGLAASWAGADVRVGVHWLSADGAEVAWDGPRCDSIDLRWLGLAAARRAIRIGWPPPDAARARVDLVAEGVAWGSSVGLDTAELALPPVPDLEDAEGPGRGPAAPDEDPAATREWLSAAWPQDAREAEMANYVGADLARFLMSVQLVADPGRTLEIGANPYFITRLLGARYPEAELTLTNYFGGQEAELEQAVVDASGAEVARFRSDLVDVEAAPLPYPDESFDTVLMCEVIEHLVVDPVHALREIHRVLVPGGRLLLTTPNVARATNLHRLAQRQGIYDPYSRYGIHGRHNREYVAEELFEVLSANGYTVERYLTRPVHGVPEPGPAWFAAGDDDGAGDYHFLVARRGPPTDAVRPAWLYR